MKQISFFLLVGFISGLLGACSKESIEPQSEIQQAESFIGTDYDSVIYYAEKYLKKVDDKEDQYYGHFVLGYGFMKKKEYLKATANYLNAYELIPSEKSFDQKRADILVNLGLVAKTFLAYEHAIAYYEESLKYDSENGNADILYNMGNVYKNQEKYDDAIEQFSKSLALALKFEQRKRISKAKIQLGVVYARQELFDKSNKQFLAVIDEAQANGTDKYTSRAYHYLANNYMSEKAYSMAIELFSKALSNNAANTDQFITFLDRGDCYLRMSESKNALESLLRAEALYPSVSPNPEYAEVYNLLATAYEQNEDTRSTTSNLRIYGAELKGFLQQKEEIIKLLNKQRFEQLVNSRATLNDLWKLLFTYRNMGVLAIIGVCLLLLVLGYKYYRSVQLKKQIARELNSI